MDNDEDEPMRLNRGQTNGKRRYGRVGKWGGCVGVTFATGLGFGSPALAETTNLPNGVSCARPAVGDSWTCQVPTANGAFATVSGVPVGAAPTDVDLVALNNFIASNIGTGAIAIGNMATNASGTNSVAIGPGATATNANSVALGAGSVTGPAVGTASTTIAGQTYNFAGAVPAGTVSVGAAGQERTVTNVAAGRISADSTDAVNGSQLHATNQAVGALDKFAVKYDNDGTNKFNSITLSGGDPNTPVVISNVAAGVNATDAVNVGQLKQSFSTTLNQANSYTQMQVAWGIQESKTYTNQVAAQTLGQANAYTDQKFALLNGEIGSVRKEARQAAAVGLAAASLRYDDRPGKLSAAVGAGAWHSQGALAFGVGYTSDNGLVRANLSGTTAGGQWGIGAGLSVTLN